MTQRCLTMMCVLALAGCDELMSENIPIATLGGTLSLAPGLEPPEGNVKLSILWNDYYADISRGPGTCGTGDELAEVVANSSVLEQQLDVHFGGDFPAEFSVQLGDPPPRAAMVKCLDHPRARCAKGDLVVYRDVNRNGRLDPRGFDAKSPDEVLGSGVGTLPSSEDHGTRYQVAYSNRTLGASNIEWGTGAAGYSLLVENTDLPRREIGVEAQPLDADAEIELTISPTPYLQRWACSESCDITKERQCPDDPADLLVEDFGEPRAAEGLVGTALWERVDGDRTITTSARCERGVNDDGGQNAGREVFLFGRWTQVGCTRTFEGCHYERSELPEGVDLPCTEYEVVSLGSLVAPDH